MVQIKLQVLMKLQWAVLEKTDNILFGLHVKLELYYWTNTS
jgi:hypothetical protein